MKGYFIVDDELITMDEDLFCAKMDEVYEICDHTDMPMSLAMTYVFTPEDLPHC